MAETRKLRKFKFNMVEMAGAIAVVAFGVAAMMGVFPTILKQGKRATEENHLPDVMSMVKGIIDYEYNSATDFAAFTNKFEETFEDRNGDMDVMDDTTTTQNTDYLPFVINCKKNNSMASKIDLTKRMRFDYYRGIYSVSDKDNRQIISSYDIDIKKQPIPSLNSNGTYYKTPTSGSTVYEHGVTIVIKISTPAGLEDQEAVYFQYDYYPKK